MINLRQKFSFSNERLFYLSLALAVLPIWISDYIPAVDLPGQAAQASALLEVWRGNPLFIEQFEVNVLTPYLVGVTLLAALSYLLPIIIAVKLMMTAIVVAIVVLSGRLLSAFGGDPNLKWLIIPSTYSFAFYWGFFPFLTAVPLGLVLLLLGARLNEKPSISLGLGVAAYSLFLLAAHLLVLCISSLLALAWLAGSNYKNPKRLLILGVPYMAPLPLIAMWLLAAFTSDSSVSSTRVGFVSFWKRVPDMVTQVSGLDGTFFTVSVFIFAVIVALPLLLGMKLTRKPEKWLMSVCGFAVFFLFPTHAMGTAFIYDRFGLYLPILWLVLWEKTPQTSPRWQWLGILAVFLWTGANTLRFSTYNLETKGFENILAQMEPGKRAYSMITSLGSSQFSAPVFLHISSWYQADRKGIVDFNFGMFHGTVLRYRADKRLPRTDMLAWAPQKFQWSLDRGSSYDYFVVRSQFDASKELFDEGLPSVELVVNDGWWWLYKKVEE